MAAAGASHDGLSLEGLVEQILLRAETPEAARGQLARLIAATQSISSDLELPSALRNLVQAACDLVAAQFGAIRVVSPDGLLEEYVHVGTPPQGMTHDGRPTGRDVLGAPLSVGSTEYGTLTLSGPTHRVFDSVDEQIVRTLAGMAGAAIAGARLYEEARLGQRWLVASEEINQQLLSGELAESDVAPIAGLILTLADASFVGLVLPSNIADAPLFAQKFGLLADSPAFGHDGALGELRARVREALELKEGRSHAFHTIELWASALTGATMVIPWGDTAATREGALVIAREPDAHPFSTADRQMAKRFARSVAIARELASARNDREHVALADERDRIARDLHDHVIQSLFAVGLGLQSVVGAASGAVAARISSQVDAIDVTIRQIRQTIFQLGSPPTASAYSQKQRLNQLVRTILEGEGIDSSLDFRGPVDTLIDSELGEEVSAVLREALSNVVRHADASRVDILIAVSATEVRVVVTDNGRGLGDGVQRSGLDNLEHRASARGGRFTTAGRAPSGTTVDWSVPVVTP